jgi:hypothetical protein
MPYMFRRKALVLQAQRSVGFVDLFSTGQPAQAYNARTAISCTPSKLQPFCDTKTTKDTDMAVPPSEPTSSGPSSIHDVLAEEKAIPASDKITTSPASGRPVHGWKWFLVCLAVYSTALLYGLDTTIAADVQPAIVETLGGIQKLPWIGAGFPLGSIAVILPVGYAYGIFEIKWLFITSIIVFEAGSALCGGAPTVRSSNPYTYWLANTSRWTLS